MSYAIPALKKAVGVGNSYQSLVKPSDSFTYL